MLHIGLVICTELRRVGDGVPFQNSGKGLYEDGIGICFGSEGVDITAMHTRVHKLLHW